jgi:hypothetical protein
MKNNKIVKLSRFTTLPVLLDLLQRRKLTLLDPKSWEDRNDSEIILAYKKRKKIKNLFAICLSYGDETIHHWKTFSNGSSGCLIEFDAQRLFSIVDQIPGVKHRKVAYKKLAEIEKKKVKIKVDDIPFIKRWPYRCEEEYRIIVENDTAYAKHFDIDIPIDIIRRITINQQMPDKIYETIKVYLRDIKKNPEGRIYRSTLFENKKWINNFRN